MQHQIDLTRAKAALCKKEFFFFIQEFWAEIIPEDPVWGWYIPYIAGELQELAQYVLKREKKPYDLLINIPPGMTKSTICTVMFPAWLWAVDPTLRVLTASYSSSLSLDHAVRSRDIISSAKYKSYFGDISLKADQNNKGHYKNNFNGERLATSVGGASTGFHAHFIIVDDPLNAKEAASEADRKSANDFMDITLSTRKVDKDMTPTILIMQRLHEDDPTGNMLKKKGKKIKQVCLPAEVGDHVNPPELKERYVDGLLDPQRLSKETLNDMKIDLGSYGYAGQMDQQPAPLDGGIWKKWFKPVPDSEFPQLSAMTRVGTDWDLAYTAKETNSASAYVTAGLIGSTMYIDDIGHSWLEFPGLIEYMKKRQAPHYIEAKASGKSAKQSLTKMGIPASEVTVTGGDKTGRANTATPFAESGMICVRESLLNSLYNDSKQGILKFPNNAHDDVNDALVQSINRLLKKAERWGGSV